VHPSLVLILLPSAPHPTPINSPSQAVTEYHYILFHPDRLVAVNQVSGRPVAEAPLGPGSGVPGPPLALLPPDGGGSGGGPRLVTGDALVEVALENEGRGMWRVYLEHEVCVGGWGL
jgi:hypothetical protein